MVTIKIGTGAAIMATLGGLAAASVYSKPQKQSFQPFLKEWLGNQLSKEGREKKSFLESMFDKATTEVYSRTSQPQFEDFLFFVIARVELSGQVLAFMGVYGTWYFLSAYR